MRQQEVEKTLNIMKAKKKPVEIYTTEDLNIDLSPRNVVIEVNEPPRWYSWQCFKG